MLCTNSLNKKCTNLFIGYQYGMDNKIEYENFTLVQLHNIISIWNTKYNENVITLLENTEAGVLPYNQRRIYKL